MKIGWDFPSNNNGQVVGISEAGIETFKGSPIPSLAREICQNSLDARLDKELPVTVEFCLSIIPTSEISHFIELKRAIVSCRDFWIKNNNAKTVKFFEKAIKVADKRNIRILRISDYNTTGLTGSKQKYNTPCQNLVKSSGVSDKSGSSGGSFGIGKSAPFVCSELRAVVYSTIDEEGIHASQGVARLVSFEDLTSRFKKGVITQGIGYYGNKDNNSAIEDTLSYGNYKRNTVGTDVNIIGFLDSDNWIADITNAVLDGFLISIIKKDLIIKIDNHIIDVSSIGKYIEQYKTTAKLAYEYYQVLTSDKTHRFSVDFNRLGVITLYALLNPDFKRKVLVTRKNGMKIFDKGNISGSIGFAGVLILEDEIINSYFREMETPQHDDWQPARHTKPTEAKKYRTELFQLVKSKIIEMGHDISTDQIDAEGVGDYLPDESLVSPQNENRVETLENETKNIELTQIKQIFAQSRIVKKGTQHIENSRLESDVDLSGFFDNASEEELAFLPRAETNSRLDRHNNSSSEKEVSENKSSIVKAEKISPIFIRLFMSDYVKKQYTLIFSLGETIEYALVKLSISGEQNNEEINIKSSRLSSSPESNLLVSNGMIYLGKIIKKTRVAIRFEIDYNDMCSMEVDLVGIKI